MDVKAPLALLGGISPAAFMRRHWQKQPLLVRQAWPGVVPPLSRSALFDLAGSDDVESRLVERRGTAADQSWKLRQGPLPRRALPPLRRPAWTLLVQGLDLHVPAAHQMLSAFNFLPHARLDDLMLSWASDGGGVGPHLDSYDVFLLQVQGQRRWRVGTLVDGADAAGAAIRPGLPLKILRHFKPQHDWLLAPGDMLYLPPRWAHDGVAVGGDCMTCSIGFRAPAAAGLAAELLQRVAEDDDAASPAQQAPRLYRDPRQPATNTPAAIPAPLQAFARRVVAQWLARPDALERALGELMSEPKPQVWFDAESPAARAAGLGVVLAGATRMLYDTRHVYINGEAFRAGGRDATLMRRLADQRALGGADCARLSAPAAELLADWLRHGWLQAARAMNPPGDDAKPAGEPPAIGSRAEFTAAVRWTIDAAVQRRARRLCWVDPHFGDWPLSDAGLLAALTPWLRLPQRKLVLLAGSYDDLPRRHPRFVTWRRDWAHAIEAWSPADDVPATLPTLVLDDGQFCLQLMDSVHWKGQVTQDVRTAQGWREQIDALLQRCEPAFPVNTLGL